MFAKERQSKIYSMLKEKNAVTTSALVECFDVSIETIRRDLLEMEKNGLLIRVHGGAVLNSDMKPYMNLPDRNKMYVEEKHDLALNAMKFISEGDIICVDAGSTAISFAKALKERFTRLTVITHSLDVFNILCDTFSVILCGGYYLHEENSFYGHPALEMLKNLHVKKAFIFPAAVSLEFGICDYQKDLYQIQKQMICSSDEVYILADSSKFEKKALLKLSDMKKEYTYVADSNISEELKLLYQNHSINLCIGRNFCGGE